MKRVCALLSGAAVLAVLVYVFFFVRSYAMHLGGQLTYPLFDDGMISLEYGRNFARTGLFAVGNLGVPTAGFTSYLWVLSLAGLSILVTSALKLPFAVVAWNIILLICALAVYSRMIKPPHVQAQRIAFWLITVSAPALLFWTLRGMEVPLAMLMLALLLVACDRLIEKADDHWATLLLTAVAFATPFARPDQIAIVPLCLALLVVYGRRQAPLIALCGLVAGLASYYALNAHLFHQIAPNSYYLKVTGVTLWTRISRGLGCLRLQLWYHWLYLLLFALAGLWFSRFVKLRKAAGGASIIERLRGLDPQIVLLVTVIAGSAAVWIYVGGDAWEELPIFNRFLAQCIPLAALILVSFARRLLELGNVVERSWRLLIACMVTLNVFSAITIIGIGRHDNQKYSFLGYHLGEVFGKTVTVMHYWYGQPSYYAGLFGTRSIDGLGKIDPIVARSHPMLHFKPGHDRWNHAHSIGELKPDLIVSLPCPTPFDPGFDCGSVWREITETYGYRPHTAPDRSFTLFVAPWRLKDIDPRIDSFNDEVIWQIGK